MLKRILCLILSAVMLLGLCACSMTGSDTPAAPTQPENADEILAARREKAVAYMRQMGTFLWRAQEDITYSKRISSTSIEDDIRDFPNSVYEIKAGRLYQGIPYTHAAGTLESFLTYASEPDEKGIRTLSGLDGIMLNGHRVSARIGNDCSGAVIASWGQVAGSFTAAITQYMTENYGYLRVGEYESDPEEHRDTDKVCEENGATTMFAAYGQLQPGDAVVRRTSSGHVMMISEVNVVYKEDGTVSGRDSTVKVIDQTTANMADDKYVYDEQLGENVYLTFRVDYEITFPELFARGYLPITCAELVDASIPEVESVVYDSEKMGQLANGLATHRIFQGTFTSPSQIVGVTITISDTKGNVIQEATCYNQRMTYREFDLQNFLTESPYTLVGSLDVPSLTNGKFHCTHKVLLGTGEVITARDFFFTA